VISLRKRDVLSIVEIPVRSNIILRLYEAGKAAYSDLLDSAGDIEVLDSRGNFNYHLNFLLKNSIVAKEGMVYRLTDKGRAIAKFIKEVNQIWKKVEPKLRGGHMDIVSYAEEFEREIGIRMNKKIAETKLKGRIEMVMDEKSVIGLLDEEKCEDDFFKDYEEIQISDMRLSVKIREDKNGKKFNHYVLGHPDLSYYLSPHYFGSALLYLQMNFGEARLFADKKKPMPFMLRAKKLGERYGGPAFLIAPVVLDKHQK